MATETSVGVSGGGGVNSGGGRRYVDSETESPKKGHRRAASLNVRGLEKQRAVEREYAPQDPAPPLELADDDGGLMQQGRAQARTRRNLARDRSSPIVHVHIHNAAPSAPVLPIVHPEAIVPRSVDRVLRSAKVQGHRRANSWDPRKEQEKADSLRAPAQGSQLREPQTEDASSSVTTTLPVDVLADALAARKAELVAKERALQAKQARQEAELRSLATTSPGGTVESEVAELLRLQRKLISQQPILTGKLGNVPAPKQVHEEADGALVDTLEGLNQELEHLKRKTLSIEKRVKELRCPGPTPLEMLTGMSQPQAMRLTSTSNDGRTFSREAPVTVLVKRVAPRRSPVDERERPSSPNQAYTGSLGKEGVKSAFSSFSSFSPSTKPLGGDFGQEDYDGGNV